MVTSPRARRLLQTLLPIPVVLLLAAWLMLARCGGPASLLGPDGGDGLDDAQDLGPVTSLRVHYPAGAAPQGLTVRGSAARLSWSAGKAMTAAGADTFVFTTRNLKNGQLEWKPLLGDQAWAKGPNFLAKAGETVDVWPWFSHDNGSVQRVDDWWSNGLQNQRPVWLYLPPSYDEQPGRTYPVVYMHDGQNLFDDTFAFGGVTWRVAEAMDAGAFDGSIREAIVVGVGTTDGRIWEYTPTDGGHGGGGADKYLKFLVEELKPQMDANLRTRTARLDTAIVGSSLGGLITAIAGVSRPDVFGLVGALSPSTWWDDTWLLGAVKGAAQAPVKPARVYVDSGDAGEDDDDVVNTSALAQAYVDGGGSAVQHVVGHGDTHTESAWARRLPGALRFLLGPR